MHAVQLLDKGDFGKMTSLNGEHIKAIPLAEATRKKKLVSLESDLIKLADLMTKVIYQSK